MWFLIGKYVVCFLYYFKANYVFKKSLWHHMDDYYSLWDELCTVTCELVYSHTIITRSIFVIFRLELFFDFIFTYILRHKI